MEGYWVSRPRIDGECYIIWVPGAPPRSLLALKASRTPFRRATETEGGIFRRPPGVKAIFEERGGVLFLTMPIYIETPDHVDYATDAAFIDQHDPEVKSKKAERGELNEKVA